MGLDSVDLSMFRETLTGISGQIKEQNRKLDDLIAAVLTLASVDQRRLHIDHVCESDDVMEHFAIIRELLEGRK